MIKLVDGRLCRVRVGLELHDIHEAAENFSLDPELSIILKGDDHF
jgi:hypothetical protein